MKLTPIDNAVHSQAAAPCQLLGETPWPAIGHDPSDIEGEGRAAGAVDLVGRCPL